MSALLPEPQPEDFPDYLGIADWSASHGIDSYQALLLVSGFLCNCAGEAFHFSPDPAGLDSVGINLAIPAEHVGMRSARRELLSCVSRINDRLIAHSGKFSRREIESAWHDPQILLKTEKGQRLRRALTQPVDGLGGDAPFDPMEGTTPDRLQIEQQALTRPGFLLRDVFHRDLPSAVAACHQGFGFAVSDAAGLSGMSSGRKRQVAEILRLVTGTEIRRREGVETISSSLSTARLRVILSLPREMLNRIAEEVPRFLDHVLPVVPTTCSGTQQMKIDPVRINHFRNSFQQALRRVISARRSFIRLGEGLASADALAEYHARRRAFLHASMDEIQGGADVDRLPAAMCWALQELMLRGCHLDQREKEAWSVAVGFQVANITRRNAHGLVRSLHEDELVRNRLALAEKILRILKAKGPAKFRTLVRCLDVQSKEVNEPVLNALVFLGALTRNDDRTYAIGKVPLERIDARLLIETRS